MLELPFVLLGVAAILGALIPGRWGHRTSCLLSTVASAIFMFLALASLAGGKESLTLLYGIAEMPFSLDEVTSLFMLIFSVPYLLVSVYTIKFLEERNLLRWSRMHSFCYPLFLASMFAILTVRSGLWLIVFWEIMSLSSYFLVVLNHESEEVRRAGFIYFVMSHVAEALLIVVIATLAACSSSFTYSSLAKAYSELEPLAALALLACFVTAMAIKGGIVPLHFWLPRTYSAAPSNLVALMSGVMEKVPIFLLIYFSFTVFGPSLVGGMAIAVLGMASMVIGSLYAITQRSSKRLLAYSTIGQVGYIWFAVGGGLTLYSISGSLGLLAAILLSAGIFHLLNHALFKPLLFMGVGEVVAGTGTDDLSALGGLVREMPFTAAAFLIGSLSLAGLPPFNGFASKWSIYVSGIGCPPGGYVPVVLYVGVTLAMFAGTLTAAYSIKLYTEIFSGPSKIRGSVRRTSKVMLVPELVLAVLCLVLGIFPGLAYSTIFPAVHSVMPSVSLSALLESISFFLSFLVIPSTTPISSISFLALAVMIPVVTAAVYGAARPSKARLDDVWLGGYTHDLEDTKLPASSFFAGLEDLLKTLYSVRVRVPRISFSEPDADRVMIRPWVRLGEILGEIRRIQTGYLQFYTAVLLLLIILALLVGVIFT